MGSWHWSLLMICMTSFGLGVTSFQIMTNDETEFMSLEWETSITDTSSAEYPTSETEGETSTTDSLTTQFTIIDTNLTTVPPTSETYLTDTLPTVYTTSETNPTDTLITVFTTSKTNPTDTLPTVFTTSETSPTDSLPTVYTTSETNPTDTLITVFTTSKTNPTDTLPTVFTTSETSPTDSLITVVTTSETSNTGTMPTDNSTSILTTPESFNTATIPTFTSKSTPTETFITGTTSTGISATETSQTVTFVNTSPTTQSFSESTTGNISSSSFTSTTSEATTTNPGEVLKCKNDGYFDGIKCVCRIYFYGTLCEFLNDFIVVVNITITVTVTVKLMNEFGDDVLIQSSENNTKFIKKFNDKMGKFYDENIPHYKNLTIRKLSKGSVIVDHDVDLEFDVTNSYSKADYDSTVTKLTSILKNTQWINQADEEDAFHLDNNLAVVRSSPYLDVCALAVSKDFARYLYFLNNTKYGSVCVTNCSKQNKYNLNCKVGQCSVNDRGPRCYCPFSDSYWYTGDRCEVAISKPGVYAGVTVGVAVLLILIVVLSLCLWRRHYKRLKKTWVVSEDRWYEQGWEVDNGQPEGIYRIKTDNSLKDYERAPPGTETFKPQLLNLDTNFKLETNRPVVNVNALKKSN